MAIEGVLIVLAISILYGRIFILLRKQHLKNMAHQPFSRIFLMTCYSVASAHIVPYIVLAARGLMTKVYLSRISFYKNLITKEIKPAQ